MNPTCNGATVYCVPGYFGSPLLYRELANSLAGTVCVAAFHFDFPRALERQTLPSSLGALASEYRRLLLARDGTGPYFIYGYSFGGAVAMELAQQLVEGGHSVHSLVLSDTGPPTPTGPDGPWKHFVRLVSSPLVANYFEVMSSVNRPFRASREGLIAHLCFVEEYLRNKPNAENRASELARKYDAYSNYLNRLGSAVPRSYDGDLIYLQARGEPLDLRYALRSLALRGCTTRTLSMSGHDQHVLRPGVHKVAGILKRLVSR
jgi:thioesterase domain-containing protein